MRYKVKRIPQYRKAYHIRIVPAIINIVTFLLVVSIFGLMGSFEIGDITEYEFAIRGTFSAVGIITLTAISWIIS